LRIFFGANLTQRRKGAKKTQGVLDENVASNTLYGFAPLREIIPPIRLQ
jgi:hypothetical protein